MNEFCKKHDECRKGLPALSVLGSTSQNPVRNIEIGTLTLLSSFLYASALLRGFSYTYQYYFGICVPFSVLLCMSYDAVHFPEIHVSLAKLAWLAFLGMYFSPGQIVLAASSIYVVTLESQRQEYSLAPYLNHVLLLLGLIAIQNNLTIE
jgi:hypothetical protein